MQSKSPLKKFTMVILMLACFVASLLSANGAQAKTKSPHYKFEAKEIYVTDAKTGQAIYQKNGNQKRPIASLSKLMTLYLTKEAIDQHKLSWNQKVPVSKQLIKMSKNYELGTFKIKRSKQYTVKQLYQAALIASSNSAAIALGEAVAGGNNTKFIQMMNQQAKTWHLDAHFVSSSGLDNTDLHKYGLQVSGTGKKAQNLVSAKAISTVAAKVLDRFPGITQWSKLPSKTIDKQVLVNSNRLLKGDVFYKKSAHVDGLKTGFTDTAGLCLTVSFWHDGRHLIATIIDSNTIFSSMAKLVNAIEKKYAAKPVTLVDRTIKVGTKSVIAAPQFSKSVVWYRKGTTPKVHLAYQTTAKALPVKKGETVGTAQLESTTSRSVGQVNLLATKGIKSPDQHKSANKTKKKSFLAKIGDFLGGLISGIINAIGNLLKHL